MLSLSRAVADCSYPRMGGAAGGFQSGPLGTRVLHLGCGDCTLTRAMHSQVRTHVLARLQ